MGVEVLTNLVWMNRRLKACTVSVSVVYLEFEEVYLPIYR